LHKHADNNQNEDTIPSYSWQESPRLNGVDVGVVVADVVGEDVIVLVPVVVRVKVALVVGEVD
jgi:hypothetical protein